MPIYEFYCERCKKESELLVRTTRWEGTPCPHCGSTTLMKKFSTFAAPASAGESVPPCSGVPSSCGRCGTGVPHSH